MGVVVEAAEGLHHFLQRFFAGVTEGRVAEIMGQSQGLAQVLIEMEAAAYRARYLRYLKGMGETGAKIIAFVIDEDLGLVLQAAEGGGVDDAIPVTLKARPRSAFRLGVEAAATFLGLAGIGGQIMGVGHAAKLLRRRRARQRSICPN